MTIRASGVFWWILIHQGSGVNAKESVSLGGAFLRRNFDKGAAICDAFKCFEMDRERRGLCWCKRATVKDPFGVTRTRAHRAKGREIDLLKLGR
jgi:hypothetical protein